MPSESALPTMCKISTEGKFNSLMFNHIKLCFTLIPNNTLTLYYSLANQNKMGHCEYIYCNLVLLKVESSCEYHVKIFCKVWGGSGFNKW